MNALGELRKNRGLNLEDVVRLTRLSPRYARAIDEGRFADLPAGLYARAYVRAFADAIGADAGTVSEILPLLPTIAETLETIGQARDRRPAPAARSELPPSFVTTVCAVADALVLLLANAAAVAAGAAICGVTARAFIEANPAMLLFVCATLWVEYFVLLAGVNGRTAGEALCGVPRRPCDAPLTLSRIAQRALTTPASVPALVPSEAPAYPC